MSLRAACVAVLIAAVVAPHVLAQDGLAAIDACMQRLDPQSGYDQIALRCPELIPNLEASTSAAWLPAGWRAPNADLSAASLVELRQLLAHELSLHVPSRPLDEVALKRILVGLGSAESPATAPWARFTRWLREALERRDPASAHGWWESGRATPSQTVMDAIGYACLVMVVAMAVALIVNELRVAGVFTVPRRRAAGGAGMALRTHTAPDWSAIESAPARERPRLLLDLISARLVELNRLPPAGAFTIRELLQQVRSLRGEDASWLAEVALTAEQTRFSREPVPAATLERAIVHGRRLLEHLCS
jgi:hypothetical protein